MTVTSSPTEVWQARIDADLAAALREDSTVLGLSGRTEIVRAALVLLHQRAAEERMARSVTDFYGDQPAPLPIGVRPARQRSRATPLSDPADLAGLLRTGEVSEANQPARAADPAAAGEPAQPGAPA